MAQINIAMFLRIGLILITKITVIVIRLVKLSVIVSILLRRVLLITTMVI